MSTVVTEKNARVASPFLIALCALGFLMPFVSFSCAGTSVAKANGTQLITGADVNPSFGDLGTLGGSSGGASPGPNVTPSQNTGSIGPFGSSSEAGKVHVSADPVAAVAGGLVVLALVLCVLRGRRRAALVGAAAGAAAIALLALQFKLSSAFNSDVDKQAALQRSSTSTDSFNVNLNTNISGLVHLDWQTGYWLVVAGLIVVAGFNGYVAYAEARAPSSASGTVAPPGYGAPPAWPPPPPPPTA